MISQDARLATKEARLMGRIRGAIRMRRFGGGSGQPVRALVSNHLPDSAQTIFHHGNLLPRLISR
jgi:hypothetical protein